MVMGTESSALGVVGDCHQGHQEKRVARNRSGASSAVGNVLVHYVGDGDFLLSFWPRLSLSDRERSAPARRPIQTSRNRMPYSKEPTLCRMAAKVSER
jgi:hypothetical protein